jgi:hypothetical protein
MVHALRKARQVLKDDGILLDIHPLPDEPVIEVHVDGLAHEVGRMHESDEGLEYRQAAAALDQATREGFLRVSATRVVTLARYADSLSDLREYLAHYWRDALIDPATAGRIERLFAGPEKNKRLVLREQVQFTRLEPGPAS